jgi:transcription elongation factor S-II
MEAIANRLESSDETVISDALNDLLKLDKISGNEVKKLGPAINRIRKNPSWKSASPIATALLQKWKPLLAPSPPPASMAEPSPRKDKMERADSEKNQKASTIQVDSVRSKSVDLFLSALSNGDREMAEDIEDAVFDEFRSTNADYRTKVRSKYLNLKQNAALRSQLEAGIINAELFVRMTLAEMASAEQREADAAAVAKALRETQAAVDTEAETDQFKCGRCGKRRCKYYQLQTRSADEPMTTFVTCVNCGNRWKFS